MKKKRHKNIILIIFIITVSMVFIFFAIDKKVLAEITLEYKLSQLDLTTPNEVLENKLQILNELNNIQSSGELKFTKSNVIFYIPHQDDEILFFSSAIINAVNSVGKENVHIILVSDGTQARYKEKISDKLDEYSKNQGLYSENSEKQLEIRNNIFSQSRTNEFYEAVSFLGIDKNNIITLGYPDGNLPNYLFEIEEIIKNINNQYNGDITHVTYSPFLDSHEDHKTLGRALLNTYMDLDVKDVYFVVKDFFDSSIPIEQLITSTVNSKPDIEKIKKGIESYSIFDLDNGRFAIGLYSAKNLFDNLSQHISNGEVKVSLHGPITNLDRLTHEDGRIDWKKNKINCFR
ncbi:PIG-L family deacetylase [Romboutsia weinsteinii]|uniref:PIG-L family deacetylase n=1 Tax=Romboutsia weinsteinii TaxID=2020949 RepID=A0A371J5J5_9FIRM|nr:PIG-L family deacetylase [Romboutsia weinsteinii]RDY28061.1 PIG-L family deacetylase [Romboutsia weinsteinii]